MITSQNIRFICKRPKSFEEFFFSETTAPYHPPNNFTIFPPVQPTLPPLSLHNPCSLYPLGVQTGASREAIQGKFRSQPLPCFTPQIPFPPALPISTPLFSHFACDKAGEEPEYKKKEQTATEVGQSSSSLPQEAPPPSDPEVLAAINNLAKFVAQQGWDFEQIVKQRSQSDAKFRFLFNENSSEFRFYCQQGKLPSLPVSPSFVLPLSQYLD